MQKIEPTILRKAANGDRGAFEQIYTIAAGFVYTIAYRVINNPDKAGDATQEVFLKIHKHLKKFEFRSSFKTWLYRITVNTAITVARQHQKYNKKVVSYDDAIGYNSVSQTADGASFTADNKECLQRFLDELNPDQRVCIILREIEGLSYKEIAAALKTNINTVRTRLMRARQTLVSLGKKEVIGHEL